jgi:hypothetical protein
MPQTRTIAKRGLTLTDTQSRDTSEGPTYDELYEKAKVHNIPGRSKMSKTELERALGGR